MISAMLLLRHDKATRNGRCTGRAMGKTYGDKSLHFQCNCFGENPSAMLPHLVTKCRCIHEASMCTMREKRPVHPHSSRCCHGREMTKAQFLGSLATDFCLNTTLQTWYHSGLHRPSKPKQGAVKMIGIQFTPQKFFQVKFLI